MWVVGAVLLCLAQPSMQTYVPDGSPKPKVRLAQFMHVWHMHKMGCQTMEALYVGSAGLLGLTGCLTGAMLNASVGCARLPQQPSPCWLLCCRCASEVHSLPGSAWCSAVMPCCRYAPLTPSGLWSWRPASSGRPTLRSFPAASVQSGWSLCTTVTTTRTPGVYPGGVLELVTAAPVPGLCPSGALGRSLPVCLYGPMSSVRSGGGLVLPDHIIWHMGRRHGRWAQHLLCLACAPGPDRCSGRRLN